jgi:hypothetical protein
MLASTLRRIAGDLHPRLASSTQEGVSTPELVA